MKRRSQHKKSTAAYEMPGAFIYSQKRLPVSLFTFPSLMSRFGQ
jgi:hypothetical protein